ncbi:MAG: hypothetical protein WAK82_01980 [Streptosporangiaceae bacterium]
MVVGDEPPPADFDVGQVAVGADAELRRRHPDREIETLRSAEPTPVRHTERERLHPAPDETVA